MSIRDTTTSEYCSIASVRERTEYGRCNSQRARARARAGRMHMQIIAVGVANRSDQQKARFIAFVVPFGQP